MSDIRYVVYFSLTNPVLDVQVANDYLQEDDMLWYLKNEYKDKVEDKITSIVFSLSDEQEGKVVVTCNEELTSQEQNEVLDYIEGQLYDGLGEGFEQQDFANYDAGLLDDYGHYCPSKAYDEDYEEDYIMCSPRIKRRELVRID